MGYIKKITLILFAILCLFENVCAGEPQVSAAGAVLMDKESGRVLWEKNGDSPLAVASTTKIMTAVLVLENIPLDTVITADGEAAAAPKVKMGLSAGESLTAEQLLYALMLQSSNDAAIALAKAVGGSTDAFCMAMTEKARALGCADTVFETPNGLDKGDHHSTAHDMAIIAAYALDNEEFVRVIGTKTVSFESSKRRYDIVNKDRFLTEYRGALGIKTGFTGKAGHCFVGAAERGEMTLISVVLASGWGSAGKNKKWTDTKKIMDYGFGEYEKKQIACADSVVCAVRVENGRAERVNAVLSQDFFAPMRKDENYSIKTRPIAPVKAPIKKGDRLGTAEIYINGERAKSIPLTAQNDVEKISVWRRFFVAF